MQEPLKLALDTDWHALAAEACLAELQTRAGGLEQKEAEQRLEHFGPNRLPEAAKRNPLLRFLSHFHNILIYVLLACALVTALMEHWIDTFVILAVVLVNALIGFIQEGKADRAMEAIREMLAPHTSVLRGGKRCTLAGETLVPGDIVLIEAGDKVPADLRLLQAHGLHIQEAILTGESVPVEKQLAPVAPNKPLGDRSCMAFSGTLVTSGQAKGVVVATAAATEIGRISGMLAQVETLTTPLVKQMGVFAKWLTALILIVAALILAFGYFIQQQNFGDLFMAVVGLSVAAIPEGLPAVLTITLAVGVQRMATRNAIVRRLPAIETLGSVSVICSDKTGTLTRNEMAVVTAIAGARQYSVGGTGYAPNGAISLDDQPLAEQDRNLLREMGLAACLCNDAALHQNGEIWTIEGDPMEGALLAFAGKAGVLTPEESGQWTRTDLIPFDAKHRFMATLHHNHERRAFIFVKGAPERILAMCATERAADGSAAPLEAEVWQRRAEAIAAEGQRVLALAVRATPPEQTVLQLQDVAQGLTLLGLVGLIDPPRPEAVTAVRESHLAGISVKMITGDHAGTAAAIGREIGLRNTDKVITGAMLDEMDDTRLRAAILDSDIFARTSPEHKLRLVMALQSHGLIVAMTGDGVNDAPALKRADAGIAMGKKGSEAAKEASELVLADDNFASIVAAVREGRTVYDNIKKVISWTLPTNAGEAMTIIVALLFGMTLPVTPIQILWINLITSVTLGLALAFERTEENSMRRPPRSSREPLLGGELAWHIALVSTLFLTAVFGIFSYALDRGDSIEMARTLALNTLVVLEIFHLFYIRNIYTTSLTWEAVRGTQAVWIAVILVTLAQFAITYLPPLQRIFATEPVALLDGMLVIGLGVILFALIETEKQLRLRLRAMRGAPTAI